MGRVKGSIRRLKPVSAADTRKRLETRVYELLRTGQTPLEFLIEVYRDETQSISARLDAAKKAVEFVHNKPPLEAAGVLQMLIPAIIREQV